MHLIHTPPYNQSLVDGLKRQLEQQHRRCNDLETISKGLITAIFAVRFRCVPEMYQGRKTHPSGSLFHL